MALRDAGRSTHYDDRAARRVRRGGIVGLVVAALVATTVAVLAAGSTSAGAAPADPASLPVVMVHGYDSTWCPDGKPGFIWSWLTRALDEAGWTGERLPVSYYACDSAGVDITGYGPDSPAETGTAITPGRPRAGYWQNTGIDALAHDLAWFVYRNFTVRDQPIDVVAASMGGLIVRAALHRVAVGDPTFPPSLQVAQAVTFSTPHRGYRTLDVNRADPGCVSSAACLDMSADSEFMTDLVDHGANPQGAGGTSWTLLGSSGDCDIIVPESSLGMAGAFQVYYGTPCYSHGEYLWDVDSVADATATTRPGSSLAPAVATSTAKHSLALTVDRLLHPDDATHPAPGTSTPAPEPTTPETTTSDTTTPAPETTTPTPETTTPAPETTTPAPTESTSSQPVVSLPGPTTSSAAPTAPTTPVVQRLAVFTVAPTVTLRYSSPAASDYDVRYRRATGTNGFGNQTYPAAWTRQAATSTVVTVAAGFQYCFSVRAHGAASTAVSAWSAETCTAVAFDDRATTRHGWTQPASPTSYRATVSRTQTNGATAALRVSPRRIAVVVTTCPGCGTLSIDLDGRPWRTVSTGSAKVVRRVVLVQPVRPGAATARVTVRTTSTRPVYLDGLAAATF